MGFKIIREDEPLEVKSIVTVIYGEPGIGKTSIAFTSENPILEDFDGGLKRAVNRKTALEFSSWEDAVDFHKSDDFQKLKPSTLIFDTAGTMLDNYIAQYVIKQDYKNARKGGELSLQGYGAMKSLFRQFMSEMKSKGLDIIFIAHQEEKKVGDEYRFVPKMTGGSFDILVSEADMIGYMQSKNNKRTIDFRPTDGHVGKNTAQFPVIEVPHYTDEKFTDFMGNLIKETKGKMTEISESQKEAMKLLKKYRGKIEKAESAQALEGLLPEIEKLSPTYKTQLLTVFEQRYEALWETEIDTGLTSAKNAEHFLAYIEENVPLRYSKKIKRLLWTKAKEVNITYDEKKGAFIEAAPKEAKPGGNGSGTAKAPAGNNAKKVSSQTNKPAPKEQPAAKQPSPQQNKNSNLFGNEQA